MIARQPSVLFEFCRCRASSTDIFVGQQNMSIEPWETVESYELEGKSTQAMAGKFEV